MQTTQNNPQTIQQADGDITTTSGPLSVPQTTQ